MSHRYFGENILLRTQVIRSSTYLALMSSGLSAYVHLNRDYNV